MLDKIITVSYTGFMETLVSTAPTLRELRLRTGLTAKELAGRIAEYLGQSEGRGPMSVLMMERRNSQDSARVRDALEYIFGQYGISETEVRQACKGI